MLRRGSGVSRHGRPSACCAGAFGTRCLRRRRQAAELGPQRARPSNSPRLPPPAPVGICLTGLLDQHAQAGVRGRRALRLRSIRAKCPLVTGARPICQAERSRSSFRGERRRVARLRARARQRPGSNVASQPPLAAEAGAQRLARALCATARRSPAYGRATSARKPEPPALVGKEKGPRT